MHLKIAAGKFVAWKVREFCDDLASIGLDIHYREDRGWMSNHFWITGEESAIGHLIAWFDKLGITWHRWN